VARAKKARAIFSEKDAAGKPVLRRGFTLSPAEKVLVIEDVITTGLSTKEVLDLVDQNKADLIGIGAIVNRAEGTGEQIFHRNIPVHALLSLPIESWKPESCSLCQKGIPAVKPGSRTK